MSESLKDSSKLTFAENFLLSGVAAMTSKTIAAPIERVKLLIQNQDEMLKQGTLDVRYNGILDCIRRTRSSEGVRSFWRGNAANVLRYFPTQALNFAFLGKIKGAFPVNKDDSYPSKIAKNVASGGLAGTCSLVFVYSLDYARTRLANDAKSAKAAGGKMKFNGLVDVYVKTLNSDGIRGLYRGFLVSCAGICIYRGLYFGLYDTVRPFISQGQINVLTAFALGYLVTVLAGLASYPVDTIRRRMMMTSGEAAKYTSSFHCFRTILMQEGFGSLYKGAGANILRGIAGAGVISGFDVMRDFYIKMVKS